MREKAMRMGIAVAVAGMLLACASAGGVSAGEEKKAEVAAAEAVAAVVTDEAAADEREGASELDEFLARVDARAKEVKTLEAEVKFTRREEFSGRESVRRGKVYVRKPSDILIDFTEPWPRKIWFLEGEIVDYDADLKTAQKVVFEKDARGRPQMLGLSSTWEEMKGTFEVEMGEKRDGRQVVKLKPREEYRADFTTAEVEFDGKTLLPVKISQKNEELDVVKVFEFSGVKENPRLSGGLFEVKLARGVEVEEYRPGDYKGP